MMMKTNRAPLLPDRFPVYSKVAMIIEINPQNPQQRLITRVVDIIRQGGIIVYPTDTLYGLGCNLMDKRAIETIYQLKQRDQKQPFSFICSDLTHISLYAKVTNYAYKTMRRLLPGPYTFILEGSKLVPKIMLTKRKTAGIRIPDNPICQALTAGLGNPIISTSVSLPDGELLNEPWRIDEFLGNRIDAVIDGGPVLGEPSSVISLIGDTPEILREGAGDISGFV
jgi:tRNA threonylcarbamoyl adenosine modification protein (Sua5/YciO/YrdC/YwlC family)